MIQVKNVIKKFGSKYAVDDISFEINDGEIVGFLGPNGAGKSTTMNIISGYLSSTSGTVSVNGKDIVEDALEAKKMIGYLPEQPPLYADMTVYEYLSFVFELKKCEFNKEKHINEICSVVKITDVKNRLIKNLSKGYKQRLGIAQVLIGDPEIMIFDEPSIGLDPTQIIEIRNLLRSLAKNHTVILSSHILSEVQAICNRIIVINHGKIIADEKTPDLCHAINQNYKYHVKVSGPQKDVLILIRKIPGVVRVDVDSERDGDAFTYLVENTPNVDIRKSLFRELSKKDWPMLGLEPVGASLEDVFVKLVNFKKGAN